MSTYSRYSRRGFLEMLAFTSGATATRPLFALLPARGILSKHRARVAYVSSCAPGANGVHVFATAQDAWRPIQWVETESPSALALSPDHRTLFVANGTRTFQGGPTASVESYGIESTSGRLTLLSREPLGLSAIEPGFLAVSPDNKYLAVAVTGGGSYNLLPIATDGSLGPVSILRKEIGSGPNAELQKTSRPGQLTFDRDGHLVTTDLGSDRVSSFKPAEDSLQLIERYAAEPGSGPASLALHSTSGLLFVGNALDGTIRMHRYDSALGRLGAGAQVNATLRPGAQLTELALHSSGDFLISAWSAEDQAGLIVWRISADGASLMVCDQATLPGNLVGLTEGCDGSSLIALNTATGAVISFEISPAGRFGSRQQWASISKPSAITLA